MTWLALMDGGGGGGGGGDTLALARWCGWTEELWHPVGVGGLLNVVAECLDRCHTQSTSPLPPSPARLISLMACITSLLLSHWRQAKIIEASNPLSHVSTFNNITKNSVDFVSSDFCALMQTKTQWLGKKRSFCYDLPILASPSLAKICAHLGGSAQFAPKLVFVLYVPVLCSFLLF